MYFLVWIIAMFLSAVWTLILTAPIHRRGSSGEQVMQCYISHSPYTIESSTLDILEDYIRMQSRTIFLVFSVSNHFNIMLPYCQCRLWTATRLTRFHNRALVILNRVWRTPGFFNAWHSSFSRESLTERWTMCPLEHVCCTLKKWTCPFSR